MMKKSDRKKVKELLKSNRAIMGHLREAHFSSGGDLASWRGRHDVYSDKRKERSRRACRSKNRFKDE
jgi:hypothetical protein